MSNGFSDKEMIHLVLKGQQGLQAQVALLGEKIDEVKYKGCAHRDGDLLRVEALEGWRNKGIVGIISSLFAAVSALLLILFKH